MAAAQAFARTWLLSEYLDLATQRIPALGFSALALGRITGTQPNPDRGGRGCTAQQAELALPASRDGGAAKGGRQRRAAAGARTLTQPRSRRKRPASNPLVPRPRLLLTCSVPPAPPRPASHVRQYATLCIRENPGCLFLATNLDAVTHLTDAQEWAGNGSMVGAIRGERPRPRPQPWPCCFALPGFSEQARCDGCWAAATLVLGRRGTRAQEGSSRARRRLGAQPTAAAHAGNRREEEEERFLCRRPLGASPIGFRPPLRALPAAPVPTAPRPPAGSTKREPTVMGKPSEFMLANIAEVRACGGAGVRAGVRVGVRPDARRLGGCSLCLILVPVGREPWMRAGRLQWGGELAWPPCLEHARPERAARGRPAWRSLAWAGL